MDLAKHGGPAGEQPLGQGDKAKLAVEQERIRALKQHEAIMEARAREEVKYDANYDFSFLSICRLGEYPIISNTPKNDIITAPVQVRGSASRNKARADMLTCLGPSASEPLRSSNPRTERELPLTIPEEVIINKTVNESHNLLTQPSQVDEVVTLKTEALTSSSEDVEESEAATKNLSDEANIPADDKDPSEESKINVDLNPNDIFHYNYLDPERVVNMEYMNLVTKDASSIISPKNNSSTVTNASNNGNKKGINNSKDGDIPKNNLEDNMVTANEKVSKNISPENDSNNLSNNKKGEITNNNIDSNMATVNDSNIVADEITNVNMQESNHKDKTDEKVKEIKTNTKKDTKKGKNTTKKRPKNRMDKITPKSPTKK